MLDLRGKGALLAGGRRTGVIMAKRLATEGIRVAISYRSSREAAEEAREAIASLTDRSCVVQADLTMEESVQRALDTAKAELGDLSFIINLASDYPHTPFEQLDAAAYDRGMEAARAAYLVALEGGRRLLQNEGPTRGHIILCGDWAAGQTPYREFLPYLTAKAAIEYMTRAFAVELSHAGILVNAIAPGPILRPPDYPEADWLRYVVDQTPLRRESSVEEVAEMIAALLKSETITGETIRVDSGRHLAGPGMVG